MACFNYPQKIFYLNVVFTFKFIKFETDQYQPDDVYLSTGFYF